jgi:hypothetical protein
MLIILDILVSLKDTKVVPQDTKVSLNNTTVSMEIYQLYQKKISAEEQNTMRQTFCKTFEVNREHFYRILKTTPEKLTGERLQFFANYFTAGDVNQLFALCNPKEVKNIVPKIVKI